MFSPSYKAPLKAFLLLILLLTLGACASRVSKSTIVLEYTDFGPQAMAYKIIGRKRMPWAPDTPIMIGDGKIHVVVYRGIPKEEVEAAYPADKDNNIDYRYVAYSDALTYLDNNIARDILRKITRKQEETRQRILTHLGAG